MTVRKYLCDGCYIMRLKLDVECFVESSPQVPGQSQARLLSVLSQSREIEKVVAQTFYHANLTSIAEPYKDILYLLYFKPILKTL
jgi:hypothetical protein